MQSIRRLVPILLLVSGILFTPFGATYAHEVATGNPRVEVLAFQSNVDAVAGYIDWATPQLRSGSGAFSWMAISLSQPPAGQDCHTGSTSASSLRVVRVGWMKYAPWGSSTYAMGAWIDRNGNLGVRQGPLITQRNRYQVNSPSNGWWAFWVNNIRMYDLISNGMYQTETRCMTAGGWARTFQEAIGVAGIENVSFSYVNSEVDNAQLWNFPEHHRDRNSPYTAVLYGGRNYQFSGNN